MIKCSPQLQHAMRNILFAFTFWMAVFQSSTKAATIVQSFRGHTSSAYVGGYMGAVTGSEILITVSYEDGALDLDPSALLARYEPPAFRLAASLIGGASVFEASLGSITVVGSGVLGPALHITATLPDGDVVFFQFSDDDRSFISSQALPRSYGTMLDWDQISFSVVDIPAMWPTTLNPMDVEITAVVPEPTTVVTLLGSAAFLGLGRRRARQGRTRSPQPTSYGRGVFL